MNSYRLRKYEIAGACAFLAIFLICIPKKFNLWQDEFGYFESVARTIMAGRIVASDWLAASNVGVAYASLLIYKLTNNFYMATYGVVFASYLGLIIISSLILRKLCRFNEPVLFISLLLGFSPLVLSRSISFISTLPYIFCYLLSVYVYLTERKLLFFVLVIFTFSIRQSAISLLALPLYDSLEMAFSKRKGTPLLTFAKNLGLIGAVFGICLFTEHLVPKGYGGEVDGQILQMIEAIKIKNFVHVFMTAVALLMPVVLLFFLCYVPNYWKNFKSRFSVNISIACTLALLALYSVQGDLSHFGPTVATPVLQSFHGWWASLIFLFLIDYKSLFINKFIFLVVAMILLLSIRGVIWDNYLIEAYFCILFAAFTHFHNPPSKFARQWASRGAIALFVLFAVYSYALRALSDRQTFFFQTYERLLRSHTITVDQASEMNWGHTGWRTLNYFIRHEGRESQKGCLTCLMMYIKKDDVVVQVESPIRHSFKPVHFPFHVIEQGQTTLGFRNLKYRVIGTNVKESELKTSAHPTGFLNPLSRDQVAEMNRCAPLNNEEWKIFLQSQGKTCSLSDSQI